MSIKSDRWIKQQCEKPAYVITTRKAFDTHQSFVCWYNGYGEVHEHENVRPSDKCDDVKGMPEWRPMIEPFHAKQVRKTENGDRVISYGVSSYGYDVQVGSKFKIFTNINTTIVDPKNFDDRCYVEVDGTDDGYVIIPPNGFALAHTLPYFRIPRDILVVCLGKSTYARCGIIVNVTPLEPEWEGQVVLEFSNTTSLPAKIYVNEGVAQFLFLQADEDDVCEVSYADRGGKYQGQTGITLPKA